ncbi:MAG: hypothetical protein CSA22_06775 [Deltaproteobacteria bacterium]|nr:MAG: hypothetical protein CSA22_06775 [Deltaproteobacteria bacterium]
MKQKHHPLYPLVSVLCLVFLLSACGVTPQNRDMRLVDKKMAQLNAQEKNLEQEKKELEQEKKELRLQKKQLAKQENELARQRNLKKKDAPVAEDFEAPLFPPNAKPGECYARVFVPPVYKTVTETVLKKAKSYKLEIIPATYKMVDKRVLVSEASQKLITVPAKYKTVTKDVLVQDRELIWRTSLGANSARASKLLLETAQKYGIDLAAAKPGDCFHEHYLPPEYETYYTNELVAEESFRIEVIPAKYETVTERVLVKEASSKLVNVPATYKYVEEKMLVKEAHTDWKKGHGLIEKINNSTGEIMCLVEVPAEYKTVRKKVVDVPAHTVVQEIPAEYKTVTVRKMVSPASEKRIVIPAKYKKVAKKRLVKEGRIIWHEIHAKGFSKDTRTGNQICLTEIPAKYRKASKKVVVTPAKTQTQTIPAVYKTMKVKTLVKKAQERKIVIPAEYQQITRQKKIAEGHLEWRRVLCETNTTEGIILKLQSALAEKNYDPGPLDGAYGSQTAAAVKKYQMDKGLATGGLTIETLRSLGL